MDVWLNLTFMEWINEFHNLSSRRILGHELNNFMTPLSMQVSMLKSHLETGNIDKAVERIDKLDRAVQKLKSFSFELFKPNGTLIKKMPVRSNEELKELLNHILLLPGFVDLEMIWDLCNFESPLELDAKIIGLFMYAYLYDKRYVPRPSSCTITTSIDEKSNYCLMLQYRSGDGTFNDESKVSESESALNHLSKIIKSESQAYSLSGIRGNHKPWILSIVSK
ncbi:MAG: hypothetical protein HQ508_06125 [Candidatus Marinimicrobia bacterium]|nr:hypothetical protein [Candidatus Neomarinimicrobiota bacterium]